MFYEESSIKQILNCEYCKQRLEQPKLLPCSATLCIGCVNLIEHFVFTCPICNDPHIKPHDGFPANRALENILKLKPTEVLHSQTVESFKQNLNDLLNRIDHIKDVNTDQIRVLFDGSREEIHSSTRMLLDQIKLFYDRFMVKLNEYESECSKINESNKQELKKAFKEMLELHNEWSEYLKQYQASINVVEVRPQPLKPIVLPALTNTDETSCSSDQELSNQISSDETSCSADLQFSKHNDESDCESPLNASFQDLSEPSKEIKQKLQEKIIEPETKEEISLGFIVAQTLNLLQRGFPSKPSDLDTNNSNNAYNLSSSILNREQVIQLMNLCGFSLEQEWSLVYRASRDGFSAADFHSRCDSCPNSLIVIKSTHDCVFGGYTEADWSGDSGYKSDDSTFLFSLINREKQPLVMKCIRETNAIYVKQGK